MYSKSKRAVWIQDPFHMPDVESFPYRTGDRQGGTMEDHAEDTPPVQHGF